MCDKPKFEVGQIWETDHPSEPYLRIVCIDRKDSGFPIIACYSNYPEMYSEGVTFLTAVGTFGGMTNFKVTKLYVPKKTIKTKLYWWKDRMVNGREWIVKDIDYRNNLNYQHSQVLAIKEVELTEGEGLDV